MDREELLNDVEEAQRLILDGSQACLWTAIPGIVSKVDLAAMTCEVQPAIQGQITDDDGSVTFVNLPLLLDVPIVFPSAGGFTITFPVVVGDEVLVVFASRAIDSWWQSSGVQKPVEMRMHDLSDGFAIPGPKSQPNKISSISTTNLQIRNNAGTVYFSVNASGKLTVRNVAKNLKTVLDGMLDIVNTLQTSLSAFATTTATDPIALVTAGAAATLIPQLTALAASITAYKTADIGGLLE